MALFIQPPPVSFGPKWDYSQTASEVTAILTQMGQSAVLRRGLGAVTGDRWIRTFLRRWTATEMAGGLVDPLTRYALVAPVDPPPDHDLDRMVIFSQPIGDVPVEIESLRIISRPEPVRPAGVLLFWKLVVRR